MPVVVHAGIAYVSGQLPWQGDELGPLGKLGREVSLEQAQELGAPLRAAGARLAQPDADRRARRSRAALRLTGYVASSPGFDQQPKVIDACVRDPGQGVGHAGQHARSAIGVAELPRNVPVEIEFTFALKRRPSPAQRFRRPGFPVVEMR